MEESLFREYYKMCLGLVNKMEELSNLCLKLEEFKKEINITCDEFSFTEEQIKKLTKPEERIETYGEIIGEWI